MTFISAVGTDAFGDEIRAFYNAKHVKNHFVISNKPTGCAGIFVNNTTSDNMI